MITKNKQKPKPKTPMPSEVFYVVEDKNGFWLSNVPGNGKNETTHHGPVPKAEAEILLGREIARGG